MGTLGCINDMLQRDKENRELRKRNRERLTDTYHRLLDSEKNTDLSQMTIEKMEDIRRKTLETEELDKAAYFKTMLSLRTEYPQGLQTQRFIASPYCLVHRHQQPGGFAGRPHRLTPLSLRQSEACHRLHHVRRA